MRLLIITQKISKDDSYFGFFHDWVTEFSKHIDVTVIALETREYSFPNNVKVLSLGKEHGVSRIKYIYNFYKYILSERYDFVFAHMSPWYMILGCMFWSGKKKALWYVHRNVDLKLRLAHMCTDIVFTSTKESFRIPSKKVQYMNQAIDITKFNIPKTTPEIPTIITVGRITPIKRLEILIEAANTLDVAVHIVGAPVVPDDHVYKTKLEKMIKNPRIRFVGPVPNNQLPQLLAQSTMSINLCPTGGLDKAVLESMAARVPVLLTNTAFSGYIEKYKDILLVQGDCKEKIAYLLSIDTTEISDYLFTQVQEKSSLPTLIQKIYATFVQ
jgi:glycosyltransferase involved in cell wall biosynthesis